MKTVFVAVNVFLLNFKFDLGQDERKRLFCRIIAVVLLSMIEFFCEFCSTVLFKSEKYKLRKTDENPLKNKLKKITQ